MSPMSLTHKQLECIALLNTGMSQKEAAKALNITPKTIQRWQKETDFFQAMKVSEVEQIKTHQTTEVLTEVVGGIWESRDKLREKELALLNHLEELLINSLKDDTSNFRAVDKLIKLSERRSKLLGLDIKNIAILDAVQVLLCNRILSLKQAQVVSKGIDYILEELKIFDV